MFADETKRTKVKICGLTNLQDARFASGSMVHYLGFIFFDESPRYIQPSKAGAIINWIEGPKCVGVFVNQPLDDVNMIAGETGIDMVQLHGTESPEYCALTDKPVIKVIHIQKDSTPSDIRDQIARYRDSVDYLMFDTKVEDKWGGTGQTFDWSLLTDAAGDIPFFLSGGLNSQNIHHACQTVKPYAVDLSSSLEERPGKKDFDEIDRFMNNMEEIWEKQELGQF